MHGKLVSLRPLEISDAQKLWDLIGDDADTWKWVGSGAPVPASANDLHNEFLRKINRPDSEYFAIIDKVMGTVIGSTAYLDIREEDCHFEIGSTFIAPTFRGGNRNIEAKYLMMTEAFENRGAVRITIKANAANVRSRKAIEKIGAKLEGLLRNQRQERDGTWRTAAYHSVIVEDWPETKAKLEKIDRKSVV
jgi:RimJ/RimL family protein N-acetyltransferase